MGASKRKLPAAAAKGVTKERRRRVRRPLSHALDIDSLAAKLPIPRLRSKHHSYFEFVENKEKKKKLNLQTTHDKCPPCGCEFVPIGNPELTTACKELSREGGLQVYIVSDSHSNGIARSYAHQMNRIGYHFQKAIVQEARATIVGLSQLAASVPDGEPEPIPESQVQYHSQVDAALRDLFPRIPHTDRQMIIQHAFTRVILSVRSDEKGRVETKNAPQDTRSKGEERERVGLQPDIPLARRVQLAVLAHIRHNHTRYDELLKQSGWRVARKAVEALCLDVLVKWRGDEETGRDQLEEILREIVVISDSEDDELEQDSTDDASVVELDTPPPAVPSRQPSAPIALKLLPPRANPQGSEPLSSPRPSVAADDNGQGYGKDRRARRGFQRYRRAWDEAIRRRDDVGPFVPPRDVRGAADRLDPYGLSSTRASQPHLILPALGGYLRQGLPTYPQVPGNAPAAPVGPVYGEVVSVTREQPFREAGLHCQRPLVRHQSEDILLRSAEPALPEPGHLSSAHGIPVGMEDWPQNLSTRPRMHHRRGRAPSPMLRPRRDEYSPSGRRVMSDHWPRGRELPDNLHIEGPVQSHGSRDLEFCHAEARGNADANALLPHAARAHRAAVSSSQPAVDRIVVNASWPGTHTGPILMEDRGGFFERVVGRPDRIPSPPRACESPEVWRSSYRTRATYQGYPNGSQIDSRGLQDDSMPIGSEVITSSRSGAVSSGTGFQSAYEHGRLLSASWQHDHRVDHVPSFDDCDPHPRPVLGEHRSSSPLSHWEKLHIDGQSVLTSHAPYQTDYQHCHKRPASDYHYGNFGREHPLRPPFADVAQ